MKYSYTKKKVGGFSLIEMLTVIAIIGILASVIMPNLTGARARARDSERVTEVSELVLALELFYNACRDYPPSGTLSTGSNVGGCSATLGDFISTVPDDPTGGGYDYVSGGGSFVVRAKLETNSSALSDDLDTAPGGLSLTCTDVAPDALYYCKGG